MSAHLPTDAAFISTPQIDEVLQSATLHPATLAALAQEDIDMTHIDVELLGCDLWTPFMGDEAGASSSLLARGSDRASDRQVDPSEQLYSTLPLTADDLLFDQLLATATTTGGTAAGPSSPESPAAPKIKLEAEEAPTVKIEPATVEAEMLLPPPPLLSPAAGRQSGSRHRRRAAPKAATQPKAQARHFNTDTTTTRKTNNRSRNSSRHQPCAAALPAAAHQAVAQALSSSDARRQLPRQPTVEPPIELTAAAATAAAAGELTLTPRTLTQQEQLVRRQNGQFAMREGYAKVSRRETKRICTALGIAAHHQAERAAVRKEVETGLLNGWSVISVRDRSFELKPSLLVLAAEAALTLPPTAAPFPLVLPLDATVEVVPAAAGSVTDLFTGRAMPWQAKPVVLDYSQPLLAAASRRPWPLVDGHTVMVPVILQHQGQGHYTGEVVVGGGVRNPLRKMIRPQEAGYKLRLTATYGDTRAGLEVEAWGKIPQ